MKTYTLVVLMLAGVGLGAFCVEQTEAQPKAPVYAVIEIEVTNPEAYMKEYAPKVPPAVKQHGGRVIAASLKAKSIEGEAPKRVAIQQWPSLEQMNAWYGSKEYRELQKIGNKYAKFRIYSLEGLPTQ